MTPHPTRYYLTRCLSYLLWIAIFLSGISLSAQNQSKIDSLKAIYEAETVDTLKYAALRLYEKEVRKIDRVAVLPIMYERISLAKKIGNGEELSKAYSGIGNNYMYLTNNDSALHYINLAIDESDKIENLKLTTTYLNNLAIVHQRMNNYEEAIPTYHQIIMNSDSLNDYNSEVSGLANLGVTLMEQGNHERALIHLLKIEPLHQEIIVNEFDNLEEFESYLTAAYGNIATCYQELEDIALAKFYFEKAEAFLTKVSDDYSKTYFQAFISHGLANITIEKCYQSPKDCPQSDLTQSSILLNEANHSFNKLEYDRGIAFTLKDKGRILNLLRNFEKADEALKEALILSEKLNFTENIRDCYEALAITSESMQNYHDANSYLRKWIINKDSLRNADRDRFTQQKEVELETYQKENKILQLQVEAEAQSRRQAIQLFGFVIAILSMLGGAYIVYTRYRLKKEREVAAFEKEVNHAMSKFVPMAFIRAIGREKITDVELGDQVEKEVTVLFTDIRDFTSISEKMAPTENFKFVKDYASLMGPIIESNNGFVNQYLGDGIMAIFENNPNDALNACIDMQAEIQRFNESTDRLVGNPIRVGMGMHTGSLVMGIIGDQVRRDATIISDTVNSAARIESTTKMYKHNILISGESFDRLENKEKYTFSLMGDIKVKGKDIPVKVYACEF